MTVPICTPRAGTAMQLWLSMICKPLGGLWLMVVTTLTANAQSVGNWNFNNILSGTGSAYNTVSAASFSAGIPTTAFNGGAEWFGENGWPSGALNTNAYLQFSITPNPSCELNLTDIVLRIRRSNTGSPSGAGPTQWSLRSSLDGFTTDIASGSMTHTYSNYPVTLTGFYNIPVTVTFRLYGYSTTVSAGGTSRLVVDNISIQGLITVLPVVFSDVHAQRTGSNTCFIQWQMNNVLAGTRFNLQRSGNGIDFTTVYTTEATENKAAQLFGYTDRCGTDRLFYRIEAIEPPGIHRFSAVVQVQRAMAATSSISYVSLSGSSLNTCLQIAKDGYYTIALHTASGVLIQKRSMPLQTGAHSITTSLQGMPHGICIVSLYSDRRMDVKKLLY